MSVVQIDYPNKRIRFLDRDAVKFEGNVPTRRGDCGEPLVQVEVRGKKAWMLFDTGNAGPRLFKGGFVRWHEMDEFETRQVGPGSGIITMGRTQGLQIPGFRPGPYPFETLLGQYIVEGGEDGFVEGKQSQSESHIRRDHSRYDRILGADLIKNFIGTTALGKRKVHFALP